SQTSAKPTWGANSPTRLCGSLQTQPNLFITNDSRSVTATRACVPKKTTSPPWYTGLPRGVCCHRKIGRSSVSDRGSSAKNGLRPGGARLSKQWSLSNSWRPPPVRFQSLNQGKPPTAPRPPPPGGSVTAPLLYRSSGDPGGPGTP